MGSEMCIRDRGGRRGALTELRIEGRMPMNRALDGDTVVVRLLPRAEWKGTGVKAGRHGAGHASAVASSGKVGEDEGEDDELVQPERLGAVRMAPEMGADTEEGSSATGGGGEASPCATIVGVVKRAWRTYSCVLDPESAIGSQHLAEPLDARIPKINISTRQASCARPAHPHGKHMRLSGVDARIAIQ